ncbi:putative dolichol phosphate-mannose biosynthesis regulatory protein [Clavispora lusitaniae]|nr:Dolichol phosphate-mannose biosynthesis regulatory protein (DPM2) family protein [Clavispora lusitaniae]QFZ26445.1 putative dolichol phosphate-mannose biosynthesis regulatory protein [Clavispora lusitaniae]QFZ32113.1 putative dolichol phosphate-mannose biosynthesis regulatory protein [Clavispora lusitaniae]QFZ37782.1 putative dolichol phosphate-mannose biosynthesis regulatory protein [Clavispora lusitaniae]QFZ43466.1 putative dolichol phosphate-mannose biosynthesis regulatory protein [Clavis
MLTVATVVFIYYSVWVLVLPFVETDSLLQNLFPPRDYAIKLPLILLVSAVFAVTAFIGNVIIKNAQKEKLKKSKKAN